MSASRTITLVAVALVLAVLAIPTAARADLVGFDMNWAELNYTQSNSRLIVNETADSQFQLALRKEITFIAKDYAFIYGGSNFDLLLDLTLTNLPGIDNWSAAGTFTFTDTTLANKVKAAFQTSSIKITPGAGLVLEIKGSMTTYSGNDSILLGSGNTWTFSGVSGNTPVSPDLDTVLGQITQYNRASQDNGTLVVLKTYVTTSSLDTLFSTNQLLTEGTVAGQIVPVPAAVGLGVIGLCTLGLWMRRYA